MKRAPLSLAAWLLACTVQAQALMDPSTYLETARASADLARVVAAYNLYVERQDPALFMLANGNITTAPSALPTSFGALGGNFLGFDVLAYVRLFKKDDVSIRALFLLSMFDFRLDDAALAAAPVFDDKRRENWGTGYAIAGAQARRGADWLTLGAVLRYAPYLRDEGSGLVFSYFYDDEGKARSSSSSFERIYLDGSFSGWRFDTQVSLEALERLAGSRLFALGEGLGAGPALQYLGRLGSLRPGLAGTWSPAPWLHLAAGASAAIGGGSLGLGEATLDLGLPLMLARNAKRPGRDLTLRLDLRGSLLGAEGGRIVPGAKAELSLDNIRSLSYGDMFGLATFVGLAAGVSYNHADTLSRMPFEDQLLVYLKFWGGYY